MVRKGKRVFGPRERALGCVSQKTRLAGSLPRARLQVCGRRCGWSPLDGQEVCWLAKTRYHPQPVGKEEALRRVQAGGDAEGARIPGVTRGVCSVYTGRAVGRGYRPGLGTPTWAGDSWRLAEHHHLSSALPWGSRVQQQLEAATCPLSPQRRSIALYWEMLASRSLLRRNA